MGTLARELAESRRRNARVEAVAGSGLRPPRMLLLLSIEHLGVAISLLGFIQICLMAALVPSRSGVSSPSCSGAACSLRHIVSPFDTCKASRHPLCFHSVLAFLSHPLSFWSFDRSAGELPSWEKLLSIATPDFPRRLGPSQVRLSIAHNLLTRKHIDHVGTNRVVFPLIVLHRMEHRHFLVFVYACDPKSTLT